MRLRAVARLFTCRVLVVALCGLSLTGCDDGLTCDSLGLVRVEGMCVSPDAGADAMPSDAMPSDAMPSDAMPSDACLSVVETCNGIDDDCDGSADEGVQLTFYEDSDDDGFGNDDETCLGCNVADCPAGQWVLVAGDCDDTTGEIAPDIVETCDEIDNDCDRRVDEGVTTTFYRDFDGDGFGLDSDTREACSAPGGYVEVAGDCAPLDADAFPGQTDYFDTPVTGVGGFDYNCDTNEERDVTVAATPSCSSLSCPTTPRWKDSTPACGALGTQWLCLTIAGMCAVNSIETTVRARCR